MASVLEQSIRESKEEEDAFRAILPQKGFFMDYMNYTDRQESPGCFHFWTALTIVGAVIQRRAWISKGIYSIYPNFYTVLTAPSGRCRKSRAINIGLDLVSDFDWLNVCADKTTPEALLQALMIGTKGMENDENHQDATLDHSGLIPGAELSVFINKVQSNGGMVSLLTTLFDCPSSFKYLTRNKKPIILKNVSLSMIGATTPEWLASELPTSAFEGGFMSRIVFVVKSQRDRIIALPTEPDPSESIELKRAILKIRAYANGKVVLDQGAINWYTKWYAGIQKASVDDIMMLGFVERKQDIILKVALILSLADLRDSITEDDLSSAHMIVTWTQDRMFQAFKSINLSPNGLLSEKILDFVTALGGQVRRRDVLRKFGGRLIHGVSDLEQIEKVLVESGQLEVSVKEGGQGVASILYRRKGQDERRTEATGSDE